MLNIIESVIINLANILFNNAFYHFTILDISISIDVVNSTLILMSINQWFNKK